jgi:MFS family permease
MNVTGRTAQTRRLPLLALLTANAVSQVGDVMASVAIPWFVLQTTGSAAKMGVTGAVIGVATVVVGFFGGPVVDRLGFKRTSVLADLTSGLTTALIPLLYLTVGLKFWQLLILVFMGTFLDGPGRGARNSMIPELAGIAGMPIERANAAYQAIPRLSFLVGPPLAGILIAVLGASNVLWINAASFVVSAALIALLVPYAREAYEGASTEGVRGYFAELLEGLRFVRGNLLVLSMVLVVTVANLLDDPLISVILPVYSREYFGGAVGVGVMLGSFGAGALAGTILFGVIGHHLPRRLTFIVSFISAGPLPYVVLAVYPPLLVAAAGWALGGILCGPLNPLIMTVIQEHTPQQMRGRVFGALNALAMGGIPFGALLGGFLVEGVGLFATVVGMGICYLAITLSMFLNPALHGMEATKNR